ncbi:hypothetical protein G4B88_007549 [Cannabis sativa]|uniref:Bicarbonate transporter-like transmembrane domain-containing protein n=1 Tax=Cannabis sativa TaxID=3483 RepID=A0A7J6HV59_CANSA|nr:hypothetical protein G4B88_007549 [Cannabis sativa]
MGKVSPAYILPAIIPGVMVAGLYFFDHSVASQLAQQKEFNLKKPSAYHYDILLLGFMGVFVEMDRNPVNSVVQELEDLKEPVMKGKSESENRKDTFDPEKHIDAHLPVRVNKQRLSNLLHVLERVHASFVELVPHKYIATFTLFQVVYFTCVFWCDMDSNSWNTIPIAILSSHQLNTIVLPKFFGSTYLRELDAAEYEEIIAAPRSFSLSFRIHPGDTVEGIMSRRTTNEIEELN